MSKINYLIKRILHINLKNMKNIINKTKIKSGRSKIFIFFDMLFCGLVYQAGYMDYYLFEMYNVSLEDRKTFMTRGKNNKYIKKLNNKSFNHYFLNKDEFNEKFKEFLKRDYIILSNEKNLKEFIKDKEYIICKPRSGSCGKGIEKIKTSEYTLKKLYKHLKENNLVVIEEMVIQNKEMDKIYPLSINTIRMVSILHESKANVAVAYIRIGSNGNFVDNFNSGGMVTPVDMKTGKLFFPAVDKKGNVYDVHPYTKYKIVDFTIPHWEEAKKLVKKASKVIPGLKIVGWDVAISDKGPLLIEANEYPGHDIYQLPQHRRDNIGVLPLFEKIVKIK